MSQVPHTRWLSLRRHSSFWIWSSALSPLGSRRRSFLPSSAAPWEPQKLLVCLHYIRLEKNGGLPYPSPLCCSLFANLTSALAFQCLCLAARLNLIDLNVTIPGDLLQRLIACGRPVLALSCPQCPAAHSVAVPKCSCRRLGVVFPSCSHQPKDQLCSWLACFRCSGSEAVCARVGVCRLT